MPFGEFTHFLQLFLPLLMEKELMILSKRGHSGNNCLRLMYVAKSSGPFPVLPKLLYLSPNGSGKAVTIESLTDCARMRLPPDTHIPMGDRMNSTFNC